MCIYNYEFSYLVMRINYNKMMCTLLAVIRTKKFTTIYFGHALNLIKQQTAH